MMDITVNQIETGYKIQDATAQFIYSSIGRIFSYGFNDTDGNIRADKLVKTIGSITSDVIDIPSKLVEDIGKTIGFYKIKMFWANIVSKDKPVFVEAQVNKTEDVPGFDKMYSHMSDLTYYHINTPSESELITMGKCVIYNTIYNISLVGQCDLTLEKSFPEFKLSLHMPVGCDVEQFTKHFHKVSFESKEDILKKYEAFKTLYDIGKCDDIESEKEKLHRFMESGYIISDNPDQRMKANDLYKDLINFVVVPFSDVSLFKKRAAGYLLELGLKKKRYSDAYYYYGIMKKDSIVLNVKELEKLRELDRKNWFFKTDKVRDALAGLSKEFELTLKSSGAS